ncbi:MAG: hypothetical protein LBR06_09265 [Bacteroidales bacterium]|nr:hypothetical protein [Bacteroidales bacterium]
MRKGFSILLFMVALLMAVHPAVWLHYCGGRLESVSTEMPAPCCCSNETSKNAERECVMHKSCCENLFVQTVTDEAQPETAANLNICSELLCLHCTIIPFSGDSRIPVFCNHRPPPIPHSRPLLCIFLI